MTMWNNKTFKIIGGVVLVIVVGIGVLVALTPSVPSFLRIIYPHFSIEPLPGSRHYTFGETDFYAKEIVTGGRLLYVIAHTGRGSGADYEFYSKDGEPLIQAISFEFPDNDEEAFEEILQEGDIDADGEP